jgi:paraquat-inducible protein A
LLGIVAALWQDGNAGLALLVGLLSIAFPAIKLVGLAAEAFTQPGLWFYAASSLLAGVLHHLLQAQGRAE